MGASRVTLSSNSSVSGISLVSLSETTQWHLRLSNIRHPGTERRAESDERLQFRNVRIQ